MGGAWATAPLWIEALAALGTLIVATIAAWFALREHRNARESLVQDMRERWQLLQASWARILLAQHGPDFHYADAGPEERARAAKLYGELRSDGLEPGYTAALTLRADVRPVTRFLSYAGDAVLRGRWRMSEAYEVLGPDVARHHETVRMLAHRDGRNDWLIQSTEFNNFDEQDCVFLFAFLLRAEQCRRGDTYAHFAVALAEEMRGPYRKELRRCIRRVRRTRHRLWLPFRIRMLLYRGRHPRVAAAYMVPDAPIVSGTQRRLFRRPLEPMILARARIWMAYRRTGAGSH